MKVVIAVDSFKGSASSLEVARYLKSGILSVVNGDVVLVPLADGGEGTLDVFDTTKHTVRVKDPLLREIHAEIGELEEGVFIVEMAQASGLTLIDKTEYNPYVTSSFGTGELIKHCLDMNAHKIYIGIGGSATNDCGVGLLQALGMKFYDHRLQEVGVYGSSVMDVVDFDLSSLDERLNEVEIVILSDVTNGLCGVHGASAVFGPQKGLEQQGILEFDASFERFARLVEKKTNTSHMETFGAGAAGGVGFSLMSFLGGQIRNGVSEILALIKFDEVIDGSDLIITGEGKFDHQSFQGKAITGVLKVAKKHDKPVVLVCGQSEISGEEFSDVYSIVNDNVSVSEAMRDVGVYLERIGQEIAKKYLKGASYEKN